VANELGKVLVFLETSSRSSPVGVLFSVEKKDGKEVLGLKASLPSSGGFWPSLGGAFPSFAEVVRSEGFVKVQISPAERRELSFLLAVRLAASEEVRVTMDCSVLEKEPLGKDRLLNLQSKGHLARLPSARGTPGSARKPLPHLKLQTWRNFLVSLVGWVVGSLLGRSSGFGLGLRPNLRFKSFRLGLVLAKLKAKKWIEDTGQGHPLDSEGGFEFSVGCGSTSGLQQPEATKTIDLGGGLSATTGARLSAPTSARLSAPTSSGLSILTRAEFSFLSEDASPCLMAVDQPGSEGFANLSGPISSDPVSVSAPPGVVFPVFSSPCSAFSGSVANASSSKEQLLGQSRRT
jgi:hypothetical protein